jgi:hypothetical protein
MFKTLILAATAAISLAACGVERTIHLYPANDAAATTVLQGRLVGDGNLHGTLELTMQDGELLTGEFAIVAGGSVGVGIASANTYGAGTALYGTGAAFNVAMSASGAGEANLVGNKGTMMACEFANNNTAGHGYGTCKSSQGGVYRMQY